MTAKQAVKRALDAGATPAQIDRFVGASFGGPIFKRNMIRAIQMHSWHNTADDWARLAGALLRKPLAMEGAN
jgi:hypothetical protein